MSCPVRICAFKVLKNDPNNFEQICWNSKPVQSPYLHWDVYMRIDKLSMKNHPTTWTANKWSASSKHKITPSIVELVVAILLGFTDTLYSRGVLFISAYLCFYLISWYRCCCGSCAHISCLILGTEGFVDFSLLFSHVSTVASIFWGSFESSKAFNSN